MKSEESDPRLTAYVLDELPAGEREAFERELAADGALEAERRALAELAQQLRSALVERDELRLGDAGNAAVVKATAPRPDRVRGRRAFRARVFAAAALVLVVGITGYAAFLERSVRVQERSLAGHGYIGPGAGFSRPSVMESLRDLAYTGDGGEPAAARAPASTSLESLGYGSDVDTPLGFYEGYTVLRPDERPSTELYDPIAESGFRDPRREPLSTFSIDVDTASYANVRRFLNQGQLPPRDAVRIEELVNAFRYDYPAPRGSVPFSVVVDAASAPWNPAHRLVRIGLRGRTSDADRRRAKNLVFLVDVSGSMDEPAKLPLVQRSLRLLVDELADEDRIALVVYAGSSGLVLPATPLSERGRILDAIDGLRAGGSTNGGSGIQLAYRAARERFARDGVNRVILATDGDFNVGVTDRGELLRLIADEAKSGVYLSVLGFGTGNLKDATMEQLADRGNGNYAYIDSLAEARKVLVRELEATLVTIAKDVKVQVELNPARVGAWRLIGYENRALAARDFADDRKDAGEIGAGHTVTALYEIVPVESAAASVDALRYQAAPVPPPASTSAELLTVKLRWKAPDADASELLVVPFTDEGAAFDSAPTDLRFAAAVAAFGMCLRDSELRGGATLADVHRWAEPALGSDPHGDRREFLRLVDVAAGLSGR